ncbi:hypothetical protein FHG87_017631 [Trinorchestia longiramus]|nr:hypothetical protein FHG87_017631 [Trinorchestia longiramus]
MHTTLVNCAKKRFARKTYAGKTFAGPGARYPLPCGGYPATGRGQTAVPFPYVPIRDLKLKNKVSGQYEQDTDTRCLQEMGLLLACYKKHDFSQALCAAEAEVLTNCHKKAREEQKLRKAKEQEKAMDPGAKQLNARQVNVLLKRFPQKLNEEVYGKLRN